MRTTVTAVQEIIETDETVLTVAPFIETANALVTEVCATILQTDGVTPYYDSTRLELIERWLAAHFYAIRDPRRVSESVGSVREVFQFRLGLHLDVTTYGQQAMLLDTQGGLARLSASMKAGGKNGAGSRLISQVGVIWMGTTFDDAGNVVEGP